MTKVKERIDSPSMIKVNKPNLKENNNKRFVDLFCTYLRHFGQVKFILNWLRKLA